MILDPSALLAILFDEPDGPALWRRIAEASIRWISSAHAVEAWIVAERRANPAQGPALDALLETRGIDIVPVSVQQCMAA
jgi:ribonuclease VapC